MRTVAALAGVGKTTVSRVFNADPTVAQDLAERVHRAAAQLDYHPNRAAGDLRRRDGRSSTIGLLIQDVANPFYATVFRAVEDVAHLHGFVVLASNLDDDAERERQLVANFISRRVGGLVMIPAGYDHSYLQPLQRSGTPIVFVDRPPILLTADSVVSDCEVGARTAVLHLAAHGHRRIGFVGEATAHAPAQQRYAGYVAALRELGLPLDPAIVRRDADTQTKAAAACVQILSVADPPTAFFAAHNQSALGVLAAYTELGCEHSRALVSFDDYPLFDRLSPAITVVAQDPRALGTKAADIVFSRLGGDTSPPREHVVATRLIARGSGEISGRQGHRKGEAAK